MNPYDNLERLNIALKAPAQPAASFQLFVRSGKLIYLSGHLARHADGSVYAGRLGAGLRVEDGQRAARGIAIDLIATLQAACEGDLRRVRRIVKVMSLVNSSPDFTDQHLVTNGCSDLLGEVFGAAGAHARSAFGVAQIPLGACVEIEMIAEVD